MKVRERPSAIFGLVLHGHNCHKMSHKKTGKQNKCHKMSHTFILFVTFCDNIFLMNSFCCIHFMFLRPVVFSTSAAARRPLTLQTEAPRRSAAPPPAVCSPPVPDDLLRAAASAVAAPRGARAEVAEEQHHLDLIIKNLTRII